ncbi:MAG: precorrin-4 C(11)-methyltransferase [Oscillospiraceae bacterium]|nr:precorrin-4 C(11)-methyltransferase [Oscillospiraceae bacterium]
MVHFVGAGSGAADLITLRGAERLKGADVVVYAGSLVNPVLLGLCREGCAVYNSAEMTLEQVLSVMERGEEEGKDVVRLHTGDPCLYGAIQEQMDALNSRGIPFDLTPGVSSFCAAAAAVQGEYTLPGISQTVIITRMEGRTPVPEGQQLAALAAHGATMVIFLSAGLLEGVQRELLKGAYTEDTPAALVYKASWPEERVAYCPLGRLARTGQESGISKTALVLVGEFLRRGGYQRSRLYDPAFTTGFRRGKP